MSIWYDQSGSGNDATQAAASQPLIVSSGTIMTHSNARPALVLNGSTSNLDSGVSLGTSYSLNTVVSRTASSTSFRRLMNVGGSTLDTRLLVGLFDDFYTTFAGNGIIWRDTAANLPTTVIPVNASSNPVTMSVTVGGGDLVPYINGSVQNTKNGSTVSASGLNIGGRYSNNNSQLWIGRVSEVLVFGSVLSGSQRSALQQSQKAYFGTP